MKSFQIVFIILMLLFLLGSNFYVFYRLWTMLPTTIIGRILLIVSAILIFSSLFLALFAGGVLPSSLVSILYKTGTSWFFIFLYLLIIFLVLDLLRITHLLPVERFMYHSWIGFGVLTALITLVMTLGFLHYKNKKRVELSIVIEKENAIDTSLKIVALSDLHLGYGIGGNELESWIALINKENPDLILIAGDVVDNSCRPLYEQNMAQIFHKLKAKQGIYVSLGNHEYIADVSQSICFLQDAGMVLLQDSAVLLNDLVYVAGRDDRSNKNRKSIEQLTASLDKTKPIILLDHQPYNLNETAKNNIGFQFSGHTHHGQVVPISWITDLLYEKAHGYLKKGNSHIYVSSGIGIWGGKFRIGTQSEYVIVNLKIKGVPKEME